MGRLSCMVSYPTPCPAAQSYSIRHLVAIVQVGALTWVEWQVPLFYFRPLPRSSSPCAGPRKEKGDRMGRQS